MEGPHVGEGLMGSRGNHSRVSSRVQRSMEREQDHMQDGHEIRVDSDEAFLKGERLVSYVPEHSYRSEWD